MMAETSNRFQRSAMAEPPHNPRATEFPLVLRGYDRAAVDEYVAEMTRLVRDLEATQLRENVVQRALDEVGEQTASILQRAHETAEEITARSRAKAEGRLQRAEREAEIVRRDADEYSERIVADTRLLWDERQRLLEEMRQLADEVLGTADDASERLSQPELLRRDEEPDATTQLQAVPPLSEDLVPAEGDEPTTTLPGESFAEPQADEPELAEEVEPIVEEDEAVADSPTAEFELAADDDGPEDDGPAPEADQRA
jgi:cell division septum initiation protein DivIVA